MRAPRAALLDRDGTINHKAAEDEYITSPDGVTLLPGAAEAVGRLNAAGVPVVVITNQRGIARGRMSEADLYAVHARLDSLLDAEGARVERYLFCPHEAGTCACRKPGTLMLEWAVEELGLESFADVVLVGDSASDVTAGRRVGAVTVRPAGGAPAEEDPEARADHVSPSLAEAVDWLLATPR